MPIMIKRFEVCKAKGFDMTQYDDLQGWDPESEPDGTGFPLGEQDIIDYTVLLADESKSMGMGAAFREQLQLGRGARTFHRLVHHGGRRTLGRDPLHSTLPQRRKSCLCR